MALDELLAGLQQFDKGMQKLAIGQGIQDAQEQVSQLQSQQMDESKRRQGLTQISNNLVMQLTRSGADPSQVAQAAGSIRPQEFKGSQDLFMAAQQTGDEGLMRQATEAQSFESAPERERQTKELTAKARLQANEMAAAERVAELKKDKKLGDIEIRHLAKGQEQLQSGAKKHFEAIEQARSARALLDSDNPLADNAIPTFMARATGEVGALSEADKKPYGSAKDILSRISQVTEELRTGKLTTANREFIGKLATTFENSGRRAVNAYADRVASQKSALIGMDRAEARRRILPSDWESPSGEAQTKPAGEALVQMKIPGGGVKNIPKSKVEAALAAGATLLSAP